MEFIRRKGFCLKTNPQVVGEVCHSLEKNGKVIPKDLVDASRPEEAPLHKEFEWDDKIASEKYREVQAGYIIRSVAVKITSVPSEVTKLNLQITETKNEPNVRYYHAIERDGKGLDNLENIVTDEDKKARLLNQCVADIKAFQEKYMTLRDTMPNLFNAMDEELERQNGRTA